MTISPMRHLLVGLGLLVVAPPFGRGAGPADEDAGQLKREMAERERKLTRAARELTEARARLAVAEGKRDVAAAELRKAVAHCESDVQLVRDHADWFCDPREPLAAAELGLATDRAWLAEVEGDAAALVGACTKLAGFREQRLEDVRRLERARAVDPAAVDLAQEAFDKARERLAAAGKRLAAERAKGPEKPK